jgi:hypothetical protein
MHPEPDHVYVGQMGMGNHTCLKNYNGVSKSMEASGLVTLLKRFPEEKGASVCIIISDDDSNAQAKAQHICHGGVLLEHIEEPSFLLTHLTESMSLLIAFTIWQMLL